ncbi:MAG: hypothetical protein AB7L92_09305, partial [Alphaproteobacteria bacterium]
MLNFLKKEQPEEEKSQLDVSGVASKELHEFIPFYTHFNPDTIITKNGELMKIIRINSNNFGLNYESAQDAQHTVREIVRRAINSTVKTDQFAFWVHTLRRREPIRHEGTYEKGFTSYVYDKWKQSHDWQFQFYNEIYVTILHDGQPAEMFDKNLLNKSILPKQNRIARNEFLQQAHAELNAACEEITEKIREYYKAKLLCLVEQLPEDMPELASTPIFYSEPMEFLGKLCNLHTKHYPLTRNSIDKALSNYEVTFGYNALENKLLSGEKRFAGILTLKQYVETPSETIDNILQLPVEMIVCHAFHFVPSSMALKPLQEQKRLFEMSEDFYSLQKTGLRSLLTRNTNNPTDFGKQQTSVMVLTDDYRHLEEEMSKVQQAFAKLGLLTVREDIKLEECYWANLPGNFEFLRRQDFILSEQLAGFCRLNLFPNGNQNNNHWGDAAALIPTIVNSPYFFNFHYQDNGHTVVYDFNSFNDQAADATLGLLITLSMKTHPQLYIFDKDQSSRLFMDRIGGNYHIFDPGEERGERTSLNPFSLEDNPRNHSFLLAWCCALVEQAGPVSDNQKSVLKQSLIAILSGPAESRNLAGFLRTVQEYDSDLADRFAPYYGRGQYAGIFDAAQETLDLAIHMHSFDMSEPLKASPVGISLFSYLMHRIISSIDGKPTIIVIKDAWALLENDFFAPRLESLLEMLKQNNVMVVFTTRHPEHRAGTQTQHTLNQCCATKIYVPDDVMLQYASEPLGISKHDSDSLRRMNRQRGDFLLKQGNETIGLRVSFKGMDDARAIFSGDIKNLIAAG